MRHRYIVWEREILVLVGKVDDDLEHTITLTKDLLETSKKLVINRPTSQNSELLATVHGILESQVLALNLAQTNAMVYVGQKFLSTKLNESNVFDSTALKDQLAQSLGGNLSLVLGPLTGDVRPGSVCSGLGNQNFDAQVGITIDVSQEDSSAVVLLIFDCYADGDQWSLAPARRVFVCKSIYLDIEIERGIQKKLTEAVKAKNDVHFKTPIPLPPQSGTTFTTVAATISGCFVDLLNVTSSVLGYVPQAISVVQPSVYQLPDDKDVAIVFSANACAALISAVIKQYEDDPNNRTLLHKDFFDVYLDKNVSVSFATDDKALRFYINLLAKQQGTTLGKDWSIDVNCRLPVRCTFQSSYTGRVLNIEVSVKSVGELEVRSHKLNAGPVGDVLDTATNIVDQKIDEMKNDHRISISKTMPFAAFKDFKGSDPTVKANMLLIELSMLSAVLPPAIPAKTGVSTMRYRDLNEQ